MDDDIGADIKAAFAEHDPAVEAVDVPAVVEAATEPETPAHERVRGPDGKFAKPEEVVQTALKAEEPEPPKEIIRPPSSWSATAKAQFAALDPVVQQEVLKREKDIEQGKAQWDQKAERFNQFEAVLSPRREKLALKGISELQEIQALHAASDLLDRDPIQGIQYLMRQYGVTPAHFGQQAQQPQLPPEIQGLTNQVTALQQQLTQQQADQASRAKAELEGQIAAFAADPKYPYFDNLKPEMAALLQAGIASDLPDAYQRAAYANPEVRTLLQKEEQTKALNTAQKAAAVAKAKSASVSVTGSPSGAGGSKPNGAGSIEDDIRAAFAEAGGRA